jgi:hypothetical protein
VEAAVELKPLVEVRTVLAVLEAAQGGQEAALKQVSQWAWASPRYRRLQ